MGILGIELTGKVGGVAIIDEEDLYKIKDYTWSNCKGYARTVINGKTSGMHQVIAGSKKGQFVHHINKNPLDNRRENLELTDCHKHRGSHRKLNKVIQL